MPVDWTNPTNSRAYLNVLDDLRNRDISVATLSPGTDTNVPTGLIKYGSGIFEKFNGSTYDLLNTRTAYTASIGALAPMTIVTVQSQDCYFWRGGPNGDLTTLNVDFTAQLGGTATADLSFSLPSGRSAAKVQYFPALLKVSNGYELGTLVVNGAFGYLYRNPLFTSWPLGINQGIWPLTFSYYSN